MWEEVGGYRGKAYEDGRKEVKEGRINKIIREKDG